MNLEVGPLQRELGKHDVIKVGQSPNMMNILMGRGSLDPDMLKKTEGRS